MKKSWLDKISSYKVFAFSIILSYLAVFLFILIPNENVFGSDYRNFATGAKIILNGEGRNLYKLDTQYECQKNILKPYWKMEDLLPFMNMPVYALLFIPFLFMPLFAVHISLVLVIVLLIVVLYCLAEKVLFGTKKGRRWSILVLFFLPNFYALVNLQISPLITILFFLIYGKLKRGDYVFAGILSGALLIKAQFLFTLPFYFFVIEKKKGRKDYLIGFITMFLVIMITNFLLVKEGMFDYPSFLGSTRDLLSVNRPWRKYTIYASIESIKLIFGNTTFPSYFANFILYISVLVCFYMRKPKVSKDLLFVVSVVFGVVFAIHLFGHDYHVMLVPIILLLKKSFGIKNERKALFYKSISLILFFLPVLTLLGNTILASFVLIAAGCVLLIDPKLKTIRNSF